MPCRCRWCYLWAIGLAGFAFASTLLLAAAFGVVIGALGALVGLLNMSVTTLAIQPELRGRVMAIMMMTHGVMSLGMIPIAAAAEFIGINVALGASAVLLAVSMAGIGALFPELRRIDKGHDLASTPAAEPAPPLKTAAG